MRDQDSDDDREEEDWRRRKEELETALLNAAAAYLLRQEHHHFCLEHWIGPRRVMILCGFTSEIAEACGDPAADVNDPDRSAEAVRKAAEAVLEFTPAPAVRLDADGSTLIVGDFDEVFDLAGARSVRPHGHDGSTKLI
jgi:hypothetical protein